MAEYEERPVLLGRLRTKNPVIREMLSEFLGTLLLVLVCDCSIAVSVLSGHHDLASISIATGVALMLAAYCGAKVSGGHVNPAVTLALATLGKFPWRKVPHYFVAQYLGGLVATMLAFANHQSEMLDFEARIAPELRGQLFANGTGGIYTSHPGSPNLTLYGALFDQILATGLLQLGIMCLVDEKNLNVPKPVIPIGLALLLAAVIMAFGINCGPALNPARDLIARIFAVCFYGTRIFEPAFYWLIGGLIGPHLGAIIGAWVYYLLIELHLPDDRQKEKKEDILLKTTEA